MLNTGHGSEVWEAIFGSKIAIFAKNMMEGLGLENQSGSTSSWEEGKEEEKGRSRRLILGGGEYSLVLLVLYRRSTTTSSEYNVSTLLSTLI
jgi:hypothetical protein